MVSPSLGNINCDSDGIIPALKQRQCPVDPRHRVLIICFSLNNFTHCDRLWCSLTFVTVVHSVRLKNLTSTNFTSEISPPLDHQVGRERASRAFFCIINNIHSVHGGTANNLRTEIRTFASLGRGRDPYNTGDRSLFFVPKSYLIFQRARATSNGTEVKRKRVTSPSTLDRERRRGQGRDTPVSHFYMPRQRTPGIVL